MVDERTLQPLRLAAWGMLLVFFDFKFEGIDLIPDPIGWLAAALATSSLAGRSIAGARIFGIASLAATVALLISLPDWIGVTGTFLETAGVVTHTAFVFATCTAIMVAAPSQRAPANAIRWLDLGLAALIVVLGLLISDQPVGHDAEALVLVLVLLGLAVFVWFIVLLFSTENPPGVPTHDPSSTP